MKNAARTLAIFLAFAIAGAGMWFALNLSETGTASAIETQNSALAEIIEE